MVSYCVHQWILVVMTAWKLNAPYSIDGSLTITLTPNEIAEKYGKNFSCTREKMVYFIYHTTFLLCPSAMS